MNARFVNKKAPVALEAAMAQFKGAIVKLPAGKKTKKARNKG